MNFFLVFMNETLRNEQENITYVVESHFKSMRYLLFEFIKLTNQRSASDNPNQVIKDCTVCSLKYQAFLGMFKMNVFLHIEI